MSQSPLKNIEPKLGHYILHIVIDKEKWEDLCDLIEDCQEKGRFIQDAIHAKIDQLVHIKKTGLQGKKAGSEIAKSLGQIIPDDETLDEFIINNNQ
jgi:hypothetical protein